MAGVVRFTARRPAASVERRESIAGLQPIPSAFGVMPMRKWTSLTTAAAVILTSVGLSATPAEARGRHHGGWGHRHHDRIDAGDVIGGLFVIGAIASIASAARNNNRDSEDRYDPPYHHEPRDTDYYVRPTSEAPPGGEE